MVEEESNFKARAGTVSLLFISSALDRDDILRMLANALEGSGDMGDADLPSEEEIEEAARAQLEEEEEMLEAELEPGAAVGPHTQMRITPAGKELLFVGQSIEHWLSKCPEEPLILGEPGAGAALVSLVLGWSATIVHALASEARTMEELNDLVDLVSYQTLEEHVEALEMTGLVEARTEEGETRYAVTPWLREGIAPLAAAARMERRHPMDDQAPIDALDASAGFMLALPLVNPPTNLRGTCRLGMELDDGTIASATARVEPGLLTSADLGIDFAEPDALATGSAEDWLNTVIEPDASQIRAKGDIALASALVDGLHKALFADGPPLP